VQVEHIKPTSTAPGTHLLTLNRDGPLSTFAFKFNSRSYTKGGVPHNHLALIRWQLRRVRDGLALAAGGPPKP